MTPSSFKSALAASARRSQSRIVLALDLDFRNDPSTLLREASEIVRKTKENICAVKMNFHLITPLGLADTRTLVELAKSCGLPAIADIKLNDIANTNRVATEYLWAEGFSAVIVNPFAGYEGGMDVVLSRAKALGKGVIALAYMSHKGGDEGYGLALRDGRTIFDLFIDRAKDWGVDGVVVGSTRPDKINTARSRLGADFIIFSPGSGVQGGDPVKSLEAGSDYIIVGRSIIESKDPADETRRLSDTLTSWTDTRRLPAG